MNSVFEDGYRYLISNFDLYSESLKNAENLFKNINEKKYKVQSNLHNYSPFWIHCNCCGGKASSILQNKKDYENLQQLSGTCISCKSSLKIGIENIKSNNKTIKSESSNISPKAIPILLLLSKCLDKFLLYFRNRCSQLYALCKLVFKKLDIDMPAIVFWPSKDILHGGAQLDALENVGIKKHSEIVNYLESLKKEEFEYNERIISLITKRKNMIEPGIPIDRTFSRLICLKTKSTKNKGQEFKVGQKANNTLNIMPCIIDYAVNFGLLIQNYNGGIIFKNDRFDYPLTLSLKTPHNLI